MLTDEKLRMTYGLPSKQEVSEFLDFIEKGKGAPIGEIRTWGGEQYVKHSDGWVHVHKTTGKVSVLPTSGKVRKLDGNDEHRAHHEKHTKSEQKEESKPEKVETNKSKTVLATLR